MSARITNNFIKNIFITRRILQVVSLIVIGWFSSGCSKQPYLLATLDDYNQRLGNVLDTENNIEFITVIAPLGLKKNIVSKADLTVRDSGDDTIKLREFYDLPACGIKPLIAERNTTLGKIQSPSQRYIYEVRLVTVLKGCLTNAAEADSVKLNKLLNLKQNDLINAWQTLLHHSSEISQAIVTPSSHFSDTENHDFAVQSWLQLSHFSPKSLATEESSEQLAELEARLKTIQDFKTPAKLLNDSKLIMTYLPKITQFLHTETQGFTCQSPKEKQQTQYLKNVFHLFFVDKIQPLTAKMNKWSYKLIPALQRLEQPIFVDNGYSEFQAQYQHAIKEHVKFWQQLFKRCDISPV